MAGTQECYHFETLPLYRAAHLHKDRNTYILKSRKLVSVSVSSVKCHHTKVEQFVCPFGLDSCLLDLAASGEKSQLRISGHRGSGHTKSDFMDGTSKRRRTLYSKGIHVETVKAL